MRKWPLFLSNILMGLSWALPVFVAAVPLVFLPGGFILKAVFAAIMLLFQPSTLVFWIWALICAIRGPQDAWAIVYYVLFAILALPSLKNLLSVFFPNEK